MFGSMITNNKKNATSRGIIIANIINQKFANTQERPLKLFEKLLFEKQPMMANKKSLENR